jgi:hypothetical protein
MAGRRKKPQLESEPATDLKLDIRPGDGPFLALLDQLADMFNADVRSEMERIKQQEEADRQFELLTAELNESRKIELARREECRKRRLEREAAEKASRKAPRNGRGGGRNDAGATKGPSPALPTGPKNPS